jgi:hypothetical protein
MIFEHKTKIISKLVSFGFFAYFSQSQAYIIGIM